MKTKSNKPGTINITERQLLKLAGEIYFERGVDYYRSGAVVWLNAKPQDITARVQGSTDVPYLVRYWLQHNQLHCGCACPLGVDGAFCKHLVAAGLAWIDDRGRALHSEPDLDAVIDDLRAALAPLNREQLLELLVQRATWDEALLEELHLIAKS